MKKKTKIIIGVIVAFFVIGAITGGNSNSATTTNEAESSNILMTSDLKVENVMNGFGDAVIGKRAYIEIKASDLEAITLEQFQEFANNIVKDSGYNYISIIATDSDTAIFFPGSMIEIASYGKVNEDGMLDEVVGNILLQDDGSYIYEPNDSE